MKLTNINEWLTFTANLAVLAGIIFLGVEIQQNTFMMKAQTRDSLAQKESDWLMIVGSDEFASDIVIRCNEGMIEIDTPDYHRCNMMEQSHLRIWENEWYQYRQGLFDEQEYLARRASWKATLTVPQGLQNNPHLQIWRRESANFSLSFKEQIDKIFEEIEVGE